MHLYKSLRITKDRQG